METIRISIAQQQEQTLLSMCILYPDVLKMVDFLEEKDFHYYAHQILWGNIQKMVKNSLVVDQISLYDFLRKNERTWIENYEWYLQCLYSDTLNFKSLPYLKMAKSIRYRRLEEDLKNNPDIEHAKELFKEIERLTMEKTNVIEMDEAISGWMRNFDNKKNGISTGYSKLDKHINFMSPGDLIVVSARPSMGKSTFALNICHNCAKNKHKVMYVNLEMNVNDIISKIFGIATGISTTKFQDKNLNQYELREIMDKGAKYSKEFPLTIVDVGRITVSEIKEKAKEVPGLEVLVVDQLTKIKPEIVRSRKDLEIADATMGLKEMAKEMGIPIVLVHQANRNVENRDIKMPGLSDLKDSSAVEQDADVVMFLNRNSYYTKNENDKTLTLRIAKNKMGACGDLNYLYNMNNSEIVQIDGGL